MGVTVRTRQTKKGIKFLLDIYGYGDRVSQTLDIVVLPTDDAQTRKDKEALVQSIRNRTELDLESQKYRDVLPRYRKEVSFVKYAEKYIERYANKDVRKVMGALTHFKLYLERIGRKDVSMYAFNESIAQGFIDYLKKNSGLTASTPQAYYRKLNAIVKGAVRDKFMLTNPFTLLSKKGLLKPGKEKEVLTTSELQRLCDTPCSNHWVRRAFLFACYTGMGLCEIKTLVWNQIDSKAKIIRYVRSKTGVPAENFLHPFIEQQLFGLDRTTVHVFNDCLPTDNGANKIIKDWCKEAGVTKHITFYCARHTFATQICRGGSSQKVIAMAMGQTSTRYTERYIRIVENEHLEAVKSLPNPTDYSCASGE